MRNTILIGLFVVLVTLGITSFSLATMPVGKAGSPAVTIEVAPGDGARTVAIRLHDQGLVRSAAGFYALSLFTGSAFSIKPGMYEFSAASSSRAILHALVVGPDLDKTILVREGDTIYDIDAALAAAGVLKKGELIAAENAGDEWLEGTLFPDTYRFYVSSTVQEVLKRFSINFEAKTNLLSRLSLEDRKEILILASILEREVPERHDRQVVAGVLLKRLKAGMPLQADATICYMKDVEADMSVPCYPLLSVDLANPSPYNTYTNRGWPPRPIGNPGLDAIEAALNPISSPYWYYLSESGTGKTHFATTLDEHRRNRVLYITK